MMARLVIDAERRDKAKKAAREEWRRLDGTMWVRRELDDAVDAAIDVLEEELGRSEGQA